MAHTDQIAMLEIFFTFLKLGLTSFGGPVAHLGFFRQEFVQKRQWLSDESYADLVALCQFLPGPASRTPPTTATKTPDQAGHLNLSNHNAMSPSHGSISQWLLSAVCV